MRILELLLLGLLIGALSVFLAMFFGKLSGLYMASREASFRRRAIKLMETNGQKEEFIIVSGEPTLVQEVFEVVIATTRRAQEIKAAESETNNEGIALNDREDEQNTDRSGRT